MITTRSAKHLARGNAKITVFKDGEFIVELPPAKKATVIANICQPRDLLELLFILEILKRKKCKTHLIIPFLGYARHDKLIPWTSFGGKVVCEAIRKYKPVVTTIGIHSKLLKKYLPYKNVDPLDIFISKLKKIPNVVIVAPDKGAIQRAKYVAKKLKTSYSYIYKVRPAYDKAKIQKFHGNVNGKNIVIIDDLISTGETIIQAARAVKKRGARDVYVFAFHGVLAGNAIKNINEDSLC